MPHALSAPTAPCALSPLNRSVAVRVTARGDYAVRVALELAAGDGATQKVGELAEAQNIPPRFLENILVTLRRAGLVQSRRGSEGGFRLARPPDQITVADVLRATEGPLANVQGIPPEDVSYTGSATALRDVWVAGRASLRSILEHVTLAEIVQQTLPPEVTALLADPESWHGHGPLGGPGPTSSPRLAPPEGAPVIPSAPIAPVISR